MSCNKPFFRFISARNSKLGFDYFSPTPCGRCRGCLKDYTQAWSDRCIFESITTKRPSAFVTLTYDDDHLPEDKSVSLSDVQSFNKRFRYYLSKIDPNRRVKMFIASEYGELDFRPHYHYLIFGFDPQDSYDMSALYKAWSSKKNPIGFFSADYFTPGRARYCMKYINKEWNADYSCDIQKRGLKPLFHTMSNGIGFDWFLSHLDHIIKHHGYVVDGVVRPLNRYYEDLFRMIADKSPWETLHKVQARILSTRGVDWNVFDPLMADDTLISNFQREKHLAYLEEFRK